MLIHLAEMYENTELLSPIDPKSWKLIGKTCKLSPTRKVIELASGKGAFAYYLAREFSCRVDGFDANSWFVEYCIKRTTDLRLSSHLRFVCCDVNSMKVEPGVYDLGVCLGSLYLFREMGWRVLTRAVKSQAYLAVSDMFCKKTQPPRDVIEVFFEDESAPTLEEVRRWYHDRDVRILREEMCSRNAWQRYYDMMERMFSTLAMRYHSDKDRQAEKREASREVNVARKYGKYLGYVTFIMKKT